jgi:tetratricopeptide (TPR) repeat protein
VRTLLERFKQMRDLRGHFTVFAAVLALGGCTQVAVRTPREVPAPPQPLSRLDVSGRDANSAASAWVIAAEFALQNEDAATATADYAKAARLSDDPKIAARAVQLAIASRDEDDAPGLIARWQALGGEPRQLASARAQLAVERGDSEEAERQFGILLAAGNVDDWKTFAADLFAARDVALAGRLLETFAKVDRLPADERLWVALSQLGEHLGRHAFAQNLAETAVRRFDAADSIRWAASLRLESGDRAGALALYAQGVTAHPDSVKLRLGYAALLGERNRYAEALQVLARGPQTSETWAARVAYAAHDENQAALRHLYAELEHLPPARRADNAFLLGQLAELLKHDAQALQWYGEVDPDSDHAFDAQVRSAVLLDKAGQHEQAHALAQQLEQDYSDDPDSARTAWELDAQLYSQDGDHARAIAAYDHGLAALPDDRVLLYDRGIEEADAGRTDAALADFRKVLALDPNNVEAMNALGFTLADTGRDLPEATRLLAKALAAQPNEAAVMDSWGWLQYRLGHFDQAKDYLQRAWHKLEDPDIGVHLGEVLWKLGQRQRAQQLFAKVRKLDPHNATLQSAVKRLQP